jgi:hypothetical protein
VQTLETIEEFCMYDLESPGHRGQMILKWVLRKTVWECGLDLGG